MLQDSKTPMKYPFMESASRRVASRPSRTAISSLTTTPFQSDESKRSFYHKYYILQVDV